MRYTVKKIIKHLFMKKFYSIAQVLLLSAYLLPGCKKENAKDFPALVTNRTWTGEFTTKLNGIAQPFSIAFQEGGSLIWREFSGEYKGNNTLGRVEFIRQ